MTATPEHVEAHRCDDCAALHEELTRIYECGNCGERSGERRCENCHRFSARVEDGCPDCFGEVESFGAVRDHDGGLVDPDDYQPDGPPLAEREEAAAAASRVEAAAAAVTRERALLAEATPTPWAQVVPGQTILLAHNGRVTSLLPRRLVVDVVRSVPSAKVLPAGSVVATLAHDASSRRSWVTYRGDEDALVMPGPLTPVDAYSVTVETSQFQVFPGTGLRYLRASLGSVTPDDGGAPLPVLDVLGAGHAGANMLSRVVAFAHPEHARRFAAIVRESAEHLVDDGGMGEWDDPVATEMVHLDTCFAATADQGVVVEKMTYEDETHLSVGVVTSASSRSVICLRDRRAALALADLVEQGAAWLDEQVAPV